MRTPWVVGISGASGTPYARSVLRGLLTAELAGDHDEASLIAFRSIALRVMGLAQVFDHLLGIGMSKVINFGDYVSALCENLPELYRDSGIPSFRIGG